MFFRSFTLLLDGLRKFVENNSAVVYSPKLKHSLGEKFELILSFNKNKFANDNTKIIGRSLYFLALLGVEKPSERCIKLLSPICDNSLHISKVANNLWYFVNVNRTVEALLIWNINMNNYKESFWKSYYETVEHNYKTFSFVMETFSSAILKNCLSVAVKFNQEENLLKIQSVWLKELSKVLNTQNSKVKTSKDFMECMKEMKTVISTIKTTSQSNELKNLVSQEIIDKIDKLLETSKERNS